MVDKGLLTPAEGRFRDISYNINYVRKTGITTRLTDVKVCDTDGKRYITASFEGSPIKERLSDTDAIRYDSGEMTVDDLLYKYFPHLID